MDIKGSQNQHCAYSLSLFSLSYAKIHTCNVQLFKALIEYVFADITCIKQTWISDFLHLFINTNMRLKWVFKMNVVYFPSKCLNQQSAVRFSSFSGDYVALPFFHFVDLGDRTQAVHICLYVSVLFRLPLTGFLGIKWAS